MSKIQAEAFLNRQAHEHNDKSDFRTPPYLFSFIEDRFGVVEYDGACVGGLNNLAKPLRLEDEWPVGSIVYSNPPFDSESIEKWIRKGDQHALEGGVHIMCMPDKLTHCFMSELIPLFDEIIFLGGRVNFISPYAVKGGTSMNGTIITRQGGIHPLQRWRPLVSTILIRDLKKAFPSNV